MRRVILLLTILIITSILIGCNIKIGDGILTVSEDGVQYITGEQSNIETNDNDNKNDSSENSDGTQQNDVTKNPSTGFNSLSDAEVDELQQMAEELAKIGEELWKEFSQNNSSPNSNANENQCAEGINQNYSEIQNKLNHEFYFPPCADLISFKEQGSTLQFVMEQRFDELEKGSPNQFNSEMEAIEKGYVEFGENNVYENFINYADSYGEVKFYLHENNRGDTHVHFMYWGDHIEITVTYRHP